MQDNDEWHTIRDTKPAGPEYGQGALRIALMFGAFAVAMALFITPLLNPDNSRRVVSFTGQGLDAITTSSVRSTEQTYTVRRSVLQPKPSSICIIRENGTYEGAC